MRTMKAYSWRRPFQNLIDGPWASPRRGIVQIELPSTYAGEGRKEVRSHQRTVAVDRRMDIGHVAVSLCQR